MIRAMIRCSPVLPSLLALSVLVAGGCDPNPYCLNCVEQDFAGVGDLANRDGGPARDFSGGDDGPKSDMCIPMPEVCNGIDDDCDGQVDNVSHDTLCMDPNNCGACGAACVYPHAYGVCGGPNACACSMGGCQPGFYDLNKDPKDGCEYSCIPTPPGKCASAMDCPKGIACQNGLCEQVCKKDADCPMGTVCDPDTGLCEGEICDGMDNNCNGQVDEGFNFTTDPSNCGTCNNVCTYPNAMGSCAVGKCALSACKPGYYDLDKSAANGCEYLCLDAKKMPITKPGAEQCNGVDDDCNGVIDDSPKDVGGACDDFCPMPSGCVAMNACSFPLSKCAGHCCGVCTQGTTVCAGGQKVCSGGSGPKLEVCNGLDDNCDGQIDEGYNLKTDPLNCGKCGNACALPNAIPGCSAGACAIVACKPGFGDVDKNPANGCEYACPVNPPTVETCNGKDDDCNGVIDDALVQPNNFCVQTAICAGAKPVCCGADGWMCNYASVSANIEVTGVKMCKDVAGKAQQAATIVLSEKKCDGFDGNCNGQVDESFMNLGKACFAGVGTCQNAATFVCDPKNSAQTICPAVADPSKATDEACNGLDDDCDGSVDEATDGPGMCLGHLCKGWHDAAVQVTVNGKNVWVYQYEASRTDATAKAVGSGTSRSCSVAGVQPWAPVTWTQANDACAAIKDSKGVALRLCTADEWSNACSVNTAGTVWSFASNPTVYIKAPIDNSKTCNGFDQGLMAAWTTGKGGSCYANQANGKVFDMSGNVAEWTGTSVVYMGTTYYKVRGGAYNNYSGGMACNFDFVIETPAYQLGDLGFRCCADNAP